MKTGGKQYRVAPGDVLRVERLAAQAGDKVQFNDVVMLGGESVQVGSPTVAGAAVQADVIDQIRGDKVIHFVKRRRKHSSKRTKGHRQHLTLVRITDILASGADESGVTAAVGSGSVKDFVVQAATATAAATMVAPNVGKPEGKPAKPAKTVAKAEAKAPTATAEPKEIAEDVDAAGTRPSNLLTEARNGQPDDLKKISGVGPKLEGLLHANGVFHFDQIAAWGPDEIAYMDDKLSFKGRIERDNWIEQATTFAADS
ncbi:50S ribosomal protein L21 [Jannaschia sp. Os4]|nr:50S ribosomal protein L21 [Jannaschia sp. Os4]